MDEKKQAETARRMMAARAVLIRDNPFFGHLAMGLHPYCAPCGTACTDGRGLYFDPTFAEKLHTDREMEFVVLHEILHCVLEHCTRRGSRDAYLYNVACDIVVNSTILEMWGIPTILVADREPMHLAPDGKEGRLYNAEEVYGMLLANGGRNAANLPDPNGALDRHDVWAGIGDPDRMQDSWNHRIREAARACAGAGMTPGIRRLVEQLEKRSRVNWRQLLHDFIRYDDYDYSYRPPDRRFSDEDFFFPAFNVDTDRGETPDLWVCVDTSASVSDEELSEVMGEILDAMNQTNLSGSVSFFDTEITQPQPFTTREELLNIRPEGGGGTSFHVIFEYLREHLSHEPPRAILIFTDGWVLTWPEEEDALGIPVLWLISEGGSPDAPWGTVAEL